MSGTYTSSVQYCNISCNSSSSIQTSWDDGPNLPERMGFPEVCSVDDDDIYILNTNSGTFLQMSTDKKSWNAKATFPRDMSDGARMLHVNGRLYVAGGRTSVLGWYTPSMDTWCMGAQPLQRHLYGVLLHQDHKLFLLGSLRTKRVENSSEMYDLETASWSECEVKLPEFDGYLYGLSLNHL